jgi:hypothetical protein
MKSLFKFDLGLMLLIVFTSLINSVLATSFNDNDEALSNLKKAFGVEDIATLRAKVNSIQVSVEKDKVKEVLSRLPKNQTDLEANFIGAKSDKQSLNQLFTSLTANSETNKEKSPEQAHFLLAEDEALSNLKKAFGVEDIATLRAKVNSIQVSVEKDKVKKVLDNLLKEEKDLIALVNELRPKEVMILDSATNYRISTNVATTSFQDQIQTREEQLEDLLNEEQLESLGREILETSNINKSFIYFKNFYDQSMPVNHILRKQLQTVFSFLMASIEFEVETFSPSEHLQFLKFYTYRYGKKGEKTKFFAEDFAIVKKLIKGAGTLGNEFAESYIDLSSSTTSFSPIDHVESGEKNTTNLFYQEIKKNEHKKQEKATQHDEAEAKSSSIDKGNLPVNSTDKLRPWM